MRQETENEARRCRWCGAELERDGSGRPNLDCTECAAIRNAVYHRLRRKHGRDVTHAMLAAEMKAVRLAAPLADREKTTFLQSGRNARCLFCGKERDVDARGYCRDCVRERLDVVHEMTGRTNGWDRTARRAAVAADEWRGRPVAGPKRLLRDGIPQLA